MTDFRSGPSWQKILLDLRLGPAIGLLGSGKVVVAHHVEAALSTYLACPPRWIFFAHTALGPEMPAYVPPWIASLAEHAGESLDRFLMTRASAVAAVSPALALRIERVGGVPATYVPVPWPLPEPISIEERLRARASLALDEGACAVSYAGNLDRYQGWESVPRALAQVGSSVFVLATDSDPAPARKVCAELDVPIRVLPLFRESDRRSVHAAADVAVVPRALEGGVPIKLLDALARGVPVVTTELAAAGLPLANAVHYASSSDPAALAQGIQLLRARSVHTEDLRTEGRRYIATEHAPDRFRAAYQALLRSVWPVDRSGSIESRSLTPRPQIRET